MLSLSTAQAQTPTPVPPEVLGRAGSILLDGPKFLDAVAEARILQRWRTGQEAPLTALHSAQFRRQLMIKALETRVVRAEVRTRDLPADVALERTLRNAAMGLPYAQALADPSPVDIDALEAQLWIRYGASLQRVQRVALDLLESKALAVSLVASVPDAELQQEWLARNSQITLDIIRVPRVPSTAEITAAVRNRAVEIKAWYTAHHARFNRPERIRTLRFSLKVPAKGGEVAWSKVRAKTEGFRTQIIKGAAFQELAYAHSEGPNARRGGHSGAASKERNPEAFEIPVGGLTPVVREHQAWAFYQVESRIPGSIRPLEDSRVQREIAATLLRKQDALPEARALVEQAQTLLRTAPESEALTALLKNHRYRIRRGTTPPFAAVGPAVLPTVGLAPEAYAAAFRLRLVSPVSAVFTVRQDYLVFRLVKRAVPAESRWPAEREAFVAARKARAVPVAVDQWLSNHLKDQALWVDVPALAKLPIPGLPISPASP